MAALVYAVEHIRRMRGGTQAHLLRCSDGAYYVVKFQNNPQGLRVLVNDFLGTLLARRLELPVPQVAIVDVSPGLIENSEEMVIELGRGSKRCCPGLCFGSFCPSERDPFGNSVMHTLDFLPDALSQSVVNLADFAGMLVFDKWTCNTDHRQTILVGTHSIMPCKALMIDHGLCFNGNEWSFPDAPLRGLYHNPAVYEAVHGMEAFDPWLDRLKDAIDRNILDQIAAEIPSAWYAGDTDALARLLDRLDYRRGRIRDLLWSARRASPQSFANWTIEGRQEVPSAQVVVMGTTSSGRRTSFVA